MKALILQVLLGFISISFSQEDTWEKSVSSKSWSYLFKRMTFRQPVVFTPVDIKFGYLYYGGPKYWSSSPYNNSLLTITDMPVILDSTQYAFNIIDQVLNRKGFIIEVDFLKTNLPHFVIHQNYIDFQVGLGFQMTNFFSKPPLPTNNSEQWLNDSGLGDYYFHPRSLGFNINSSISRIIIQYNDILNNNLSNSNILTKNKKKEILNIENSFWWPFRDIDE